MKNNIHKEVENAFAAISFLKKGEMNPFFKHKVLQRVANEKEETHPPFSWYKPQLQWATLSIILLLNVGAVLYASSNTNVSLTSDIELFAQEYSLQSSSNAILK